MSGGISTMKTGIFFETCDSLWTVLSQLSGCLKLWSLILGEFISCIQTMGGGGNSANIKYINYIP